MIEEVNELPKTLFRFRPENTEHCFKEELQQAVQQDQIWCAPISVQNDPFDANPYFVDSPEEKIVEYACIFQDIHGADANLTGTNLRELARERGITDNKQITEILSPKNLAKLSKTSTQKSLLSMRELAKIACFSATFDSILLWSHYTNAHKGVCVEYDTAANSKARFSRSRLVKVKYSNLRPKLSELEAVKYLGHQNTGDTSFITDAQSLDIFDRSFLTKSTQWEYEKEWRWVEINDASSGYRSVLPLKVKSITVGERASAETIELCKEVSSAVQGVEVYKVKLSDSQFKFEREAI